MPSTGITTAPVSPVVVMFRTLTLGLMVVLMVVVFIVVGHTVLLTVVVKLNVLSPPFVFFMIIIVPSSVSVNVHVTLWPGLTVIELGLSPLLHVALSRVHPLGTVSDTEYSPGVTLPNVWEPVPDEVVIENDGGTVLPPVEVNRNVPSPPTVFFKIVMVPG